MVTVKVTHSTNTLWYPTKALDEAKQYALNDANAVITREQNAGRFPTDPDSYVLFLRNRGSERRVVKNKEDVRLINESFLRIPFGLRWVEDTQGSEQEYLAMKAVALVAYHWIRRRAPVLKGWYKESVSVWLNGQKISIEYLRTVKLKKNDLLFVAPDVAYGAVIEHGFYSGYYENKIPGGIVRPFAKYARSKSGDEAAVRFVYINPSASLGRKYGTLPAIEIGLPGSFNQTDSKPGGRGKGRRRRRSGRTRQSGRK